jgi:hypothetical protein
MPACDGRSTNDTVLTLTLAVNILSCLLEDQVLEIV